MDFLMGSIFSGLRGVPRRPSGCCTPPVPRRPQPAPRSAALGGAPGVPAPAGCAPPRPFILLYTVTGGVNTGGAPAGCAPPRPAATGGCPPGTGAATAGAPPRADVLGGAPAAGAPAA